MQARTGFTCSEQCAAFFENQRLADLGKLLNLLTRKIIEQWDSTQMGLVVDGLRVAHCCSWRWGWGSRAPNVPPLGKPGLIWIKSIRMPYVGHHRND